MHFGGRFRDRVSRERRLLPQAPKNEKKKIYFKKALNILVGLT